MTTITIDPGTHIVQACADACEMATRLRESVTFAFNGTHLRAFPDNTPDMVLESYFDQRADGQTATVQS